MSIAYDLHLRLYGEALEKSSNTLILLASILRHLRSYVSAEDASRRVLYVRKQVLGDNHPKTLRSLADLGYISYCQGKFQAAEDIFERTLEGFAELGADHPDTLISYGDLGRVRMSQGNFEAAEYLFQRALKISEKVFGADHPRILGYRNMIGEMLLSQGKFGAAENIWKQDYKKLRKSILSRSSGHNDYPSQSCYSNKCSRQLYDGRGSVSTRYTY